MKTESVIQNGIKIETYISPLCFDMAWEIESFLLKIFEYGNYSFRKTLCGQFDNNLVATFVIARDGQNIIGVVGSLYSKASPKINIFGPVAVDFAYRRQGIARELCSRLLEILKGVGSEVVYLGVKKQNPATCLYNLLGFDFYKGIVMRKLYCDLDAAGGHYSNDDHVSFRDMRWSDFPAFSALMCEPASLYTVDYTGGVFSSKFIEPEKFLSVFPGIMEELSVSVSSSVVLVSSKGIISGFSYIKTSPNPVMPHKAELEFYIHDNFLDFTKQLIEKAIDSFREKAPSKSILTYSLLIDKKRLSILKQLNAQVKSVLRDYVRIGKETCDVLVFQI